MANDRNWGGKRAGAGRKPRAWRIVPHRKRPHYAANPLRVRFRLRREVGCGDDVREAIRREFRKLDDVYLGEVAVERPRFRGLCVDFDAYGDWVCVPKAMHRLARRVVRAVQRALRRSGRVLQERYRVLSEPWRPPPPLTLRQRILKEIEGVPTVLAVMMFNGLANHVTRTRPNWRDQIPPEERRRR